MGIDPAWPNYGHGEAILLVKNWVKLEMELKFGLIFQIFVVCGFLSMTDFFLPLLPDSC